MENWRTPTKKEQEELRKRLKKFMHETVRTSNSISIEAGVARMTVVSFLEGQKSSWASYSKLSSFLDKHEKQEIGCK